MSQLTADSVFYEGILVQANLERKTKSRSMTCSFVFTPQVGLEPTTYQLAVPSYYRYRDITSTAAPFPCALLHPLDASTGECS